MGDTDAEVRACIDGVAGATRRRDAETLLEMMQRITGEPARMWFASIIGFGQDHYSKSPGPIGLGRISAHCVDLVTSGRV